MALWRTLGDLYLQVLKQPESALMAYKVAAAGLPDDAAVQETYAELLLASAGNEEPAVQALRRALAHTQNPKKVASQLAELAARRKDYDGAWLAAQVVSGLLGDPGAAEKEIITKLGPYAKKRETPRATLNDRLWAQHLLHPKVRTPFAELMGAALPARGAPLGGAARPGAAGAQEAPDRRGQRAGVPDPPLPGGGAAPRPRGGGAVLALPRRRPRDKLAKRSMEPAPDPLLSVEIVHTQPVCLKVGGQVLRRSAGQGHARPARAHAGAAPARARSSPRASPPSGWRPCSRARCCSAASRCAGPRRCRRSRPSEARSNR